MSLVERYQDWKKQDEIESKERIEEHDLKTTHEIRRVKSWLEGKPISEFWSNGYVYQFDYNGFHAIICNQDSRVVGEIYKTPKDEAESEMIREAHMLEHHNKMLYADIVDEFRYKHFCIDGSLINGIKSVMGLIDKSSE